MEVVHAGTARPLSNHHRGLGLLVVSLLIFNQNCRACGVWWYSLHTLMSINERCVTQLTSRAPQGYVSEAL